MNQLATYDQTIANLIDRNDKLTGSTKARYRKAIDDMFEAGASLADPDSLRAYVETLSNSQKSKLKPAISTLANQTAIDLKLGAMGGDLAAIQARLLYLDGLTEIVTVSQPSGQKAHTWLTVSEVQDLIRTTDGGSLKAQRDRVVLGLLVGAGLRRNELTTLTFNEIKHQPDTSRGRLRVVLSITGKGRKKRTVPISDKLAASLDEWHGPTGGQGLLARSISKGGALGDKLSDVGAFGIVRRAGQAIGKPDLAPHDLRRTYAQIGHDAGISIAQISKLLGHANIATTQRYLNLEVDLGKTISDFIPFG